MFDPTLHLAATRSKSPSPARVGTGNLIRGSDLGVLSRLRPQVRGKSRTITWEMDAKPRAPCLVERVMPSSAHPEPHSTPTPHPTKWVAHVAPATCTHEPPGGSHFRAGSNARAPMGRVPLAPQEPAGPPTGTSPCRLPWCLPGGRVIIDHRGSDDSVHRLGGVDGVDVGPGARRRWRGAPRALLDPAPGHRRGGGTLCDLDQELSKVASDDQPGLSTNWWLRR